MPQVNQLDDVDTRDNAVEPDSDEDIPEVYRVQEIPSKGLAVVAAMDFELGDLIIIESPLILFRSEGPTISNAILQRTFDMLDDSAKDAYMKLPNIHPESDCTPLVGIFNTNAYDVQESENADSNEDPPYVAVFNDISRMNHSCSPNTIRIWHASSSSMYIYACRFIPEGTELTTHYRDLFLPSSQRQTTLLKNYKFHCTCPPCLNPSISDPNRLRIQEFQGRIEDLIEWAKDPSIRREILLESSLKLFELIKEEGLECQHVYGRVLRHLLCIYYVMEMYPEAAVYGRMLRAWRLANGASKTELMRVELAELELMQLAGSRPLA